MHLRNKEVILRNISNNQEIKALRDFSNVCEPLKVYKRNGGGKKYFMFSPLTLFADACTADAFDAYDFDIAVNNYLEHKNIENQTLVTNFFRKWIAMDADLINLSVNAPLIQPLLPLSKNLKDISEQLLLVIENKKPVNPDVLNGLLEQFNSRSPADVEVAVFASLKKLSQE
jgi:hexosaminidase